MDKIGRKIYFEVSTGNVILDTGERQGSVVPTTIDQDIKTYKVLSDRIRESFDVIELKFGEFLQDFLSCDGYRVNPETKEIVFSYPDPSTPPEEEEPVFQTPLSEDVAFLKQDVQDIAEASSYALEDTATVAETVAYSLEDTVSLAETLALALVTIDELRTEINTLKGASA